MIMLGDGVKSEKLEQKIYCSYRNFRYSQFAFNSAVKLITKRKDFITQKTNYFMYLMRKVTKMFLT